ncbi:MAG: PD40 domain-containing protein [Leadbetterella sp.]|nr:PD40 domain-containing protein [Leadbetterella sp.]
MKNLLTLTLILFLHQGLHAQIDASLMKFPDVSQTHIVFTYANDLWLVPKAGGQAVKLSSPPGVESFPKFSPDGSEIAFTANYDGNPDVYVMPVNGGVPKRLTSHGYSDRLIDWTPDGKEVVFASLRESGKMRFSQFYKISKGGGPDTKLPLEYAEYGSYSPDGTRMAVVYISQVGRTWKRYKGGTKGTIQIFDFKAGTSKRISPMDGGGDEFPMWYGSKIYFISDRGADERMNLWSYDTGSGQAEQLTRYTDLDIHFPSLGEGEIVYEQGGQLHLYSIRDRADKVVRVQVTSDMTGLMPRNETVEKYIQSARISHDGNRVLFEARGDVFSLPAREGVARNLTNTSGIAERTPAYSPNGKYIAYWSDASGEYELYLMNTDNPATRRKLTSYGPGYRYTPYWSPDSKKICFIDHAGEIRIFDLNDNSTTKVDELLQFTHGNTAGFSCDWSSDSRWLAYSRDLPNNHQAIFLYNTADKKSTRVTDGFYSCSNPVFDPDGKYLFLTTNQVFQPNYSDFDNTFIYNNSTLIGVLTLSKDSTAFLAMKEDTVAVKEEEPKAEPAKAEKPGKSSKKEPEPEKAKAASIDLENMESRLEILDIPPGNIGTLTPLKGKIVYMRYSNNDGEGGGASLKYYDFDKKEEKTILDGVSGYEASGDRKKLLVNKSGQVAIIEPNEGAKFDKPLNLKSMVASIDPKAEWKQIFMDAWRIQRDYFYDKNMHGVDWEGVKNNYLKVLEGAANRNDLAFIIGEMIGELNASHTYYGGGDLEQGKSRSTGYLGINWKADGSYYKVDKIIRGASWDAEVRSPLDKPGIGLKEGAYILAVNGLPITTAHEPFYYFAGLDNTTVELTYNDKPDFAGARKVLVKTLDDESRLRNLAWIEGMRSHVDKATNGEVGYVYVPSTGIDGQNELMRMFNAQMDKKALIIDERFNNGGQIPDRFIEMLDRKPLVYWATRDGESWKWPPAGHFGPKVMLINGWSGSGGDAFPDYFKKRGLGPLVGTRTWGGLIGISGTPELIDGASVTAPTFRMYNLDGTWFREGHGVDPDIFVDEDLGAFSKGIDVQLDRAIEEAKKLIKTAPFVMPQRPGPEKR